ncbi:MAG: hypothetical protein HKL95_09080 [Phycisphaerae bacterium]|nr:hypothetical protein [Phycisphaerae bacterium]
MQNPATFSDNRPIPAKIHVEQFTHDPYTQVAPAVDEWHSSGQWSAQNWSDGQVLLELDLHPFIQRPGQYELRLAPDAPVPALLVAHATLYFEGQSAAPGMLTPLANPHTFNINRTAQVVEQSSSVLQLQLHDRSGTHPPGSIWIRPRFAE